MKNWIWIGAAALVLIGAPVRAEEGTQGNFRFGLGVGYDLPADLGTPNLAVASFYYKGLEIQPSVVLQKTMSKSDDGVIKAKDIETRSGAGATVRVPFSRRGNVDFQFVGTFDFSNSMADPEGPNNKQTSKAMTLSQGLGVEWWFSRNFSLTSTATNPLYDRLSTKADDIAGTTKTTDVRYGIVWDPQISFIITMWF